MPVYMIRAGEVGPMKIGKANDPRRRVANLQCGCWERLRLVRVFEGGTKQERQLQDRFRDLHIIGDWFHFSRAMLGDVGLVEKTFTANKTPSKVMPFSTVQRPTSHAQIVAVVDEFLSANLMAPSTFGLLSVNDGKLVSRLRSGKNVTTSTLDRALAFIASYSERMAA